MGAVIAQSRYVGSHAASRERRRRVCTICGDVFFVKQQANIGKACANAECRRKARPTTLRGRKQSPEERQRRSESAKAYWADPERKAAHAAATRESLKKWHSVPENAAKFAKRSSDRMTRLHTEPAFQQRRDARSSAVMKRNWQQYRELFTQQAIERYASARGINSPESNARRDAACKWILKQSMQALHSETNIRELMSETTLRLRREFPYDGPQTGSDYQDYIGVIGRKMAADPKIRALADGFMADAIPRFAKAWQERKTTRESKP